MKNKVDIDKFDFEPYINEALKSYGFLFPETDEQMELCEATMDIIPLPPELQSPSFVFEDCERTPASPKLKKLVRNVENESNWAIAAREGKNIPADVLEQMKRDKEAAKKK